MIESYFQKLNLNPMDLTGIINKFNDLNNALGQIEENRKLWESEKKDLIGNTLAEIINTSNLKGFTAFNDDAYKNHENVIFSRNDSRSGIVLTSSDGGFKSFIKEGGSLIFSQVYNGNIDVIMTLPHIEDIIPASDPIKLGVLNPKDITEDSICNYVERFIEELRDWEIPQ